MNTCWASNKPVASKVFCLRWQSCSIFLKVPPHLDFFASLISNQFCQKSNLPSIHCNMHVSSFVQLFYVVVCEIIRKLLHYLDFGQTLIEVKMETLKTCAVFTIWDIHHFDPYRELMTKICDRLNEFQVDFKI